MALPAVKITINAARKTDPTRTLVLRSQFVAQVNKRFGNLKNAINKYLIKDNFLEPIEPTIYQSGIPVIGLAAKYEYLRSDIKVEQFMEWLKDQESQGILEMMQRPGGLRRGQSQAWSDTYIRSSYSKGMAQARADLRKAGIDIPSFQSIPGGVAGVFNQPFHADRVALIYTRCFNGMKGITEAMNGYLGRELALGMAGGQSPYTIARRINERVDKIGIVRGRLIARTEIIQSHNEAALNEYERAEIEIGETIKVEWVATMDDRVRPHHAERNGKIYERSVAREMLGSPNCRCGLAPYVESLDKKLPKAPVKKAVAKLGKITPGSKATAEEIAAHYEKSKAATFIEERNAGQLKNDIANNLGKKMYSLRSDEMDNFVKFITNQEGTSEIIYGDAVDKLIKQWSITSGDSNTHSIVMQLAAQKEFGLKGTSLWWKKEAIAEAKILFKRYEIPMRRFLREMYNDTQAHLKKKGLKSIRVTRGYKGNTGIKLSTKENKMSSVGIQLQPMSSFSSDFKTAQHFGDPLPTQHATLFFGEVPVDRVLSCPITGFGCKDEFEWVILGSQKVKKEIVFGSSIAGPLAEVEEEAFRSYFRLFGRFDIDKNVAEEISKMYCKGVK